MESNLLRVFSVLISVVIFFLFPLYITYEKKDDVSYFLALRTTYDFVENVTKQGYLSLEMYDKYVNDLATTGNGYEIEIEHRKKRYDPVLFVYSDGSYTTVDKKFDYMIYKSGYNSTAKTLTIGATTYHNVLLSTDENIETYTKAQILEVIGRENALNYRKMTLDEYKAITSVGQLPTMYDVKTETNNIYYSIYAMNIGDEFVVKIKNNNITFATIFFNALTLGLNSGNTTRVYVEYGGVVKNEAYKNL